MEVIAQLVAAQQTVAELTPLVEETGRLRLWVAKACWHANEAESTFEALSARSWRDDKEAAKVRKEWDELLQKDAKTHQRIVDLLDEVEKERELKLRAEQRSMALEQGVKLDAETVAWLRRERDEQCQSSKTLRLERGTVHGEHDQAI